MRKKWVGSKLASWGVVALCSVSVYGQAAEPTFDVSGSWRLRLEALNNPIFPVEEGMRTQHNQRLSSRVLVKGEMHWDAVDAVVEVQDSRAWLDNNDPTLTASQVNTLEPLQFFLRYSPDQIEYIDNLTVGRVALDHGSRRLMSKGVFRNAINNFDGVYTDGHWQNWQVRAFYLLPVSRLPSDKQLVADNARAFDKSFNDRRFFGLFAHSDDKQWNLHSYWLKEQDSPELATKNRDLYTLGVEFTETLAEVWLANIEVIGQTGTSRQSSSPADTTDLDHRGWLVHASLGRAITANTVLKGELDLISGDNDRSDNTIHDFDGLYGVRRFDFGPTDVYQALPRRNLTALGARSVSKFNGKQNLMLGYKSFWYQRAPQGVDDFIGHQVEARLRIQTTPSLRLEWGGAYLLKGEGFERGAYPDNSIYAYTAFLYKF
ncbi:alginate export family protein [Salinimonas chungwhensis]|uniref:alginate export family protein n=1 Tax=Salinimonas chungwhensis TaxID=265425 RepID=UPI00035F28CC|nr:alginate export family protein [Salinimonas chungwhensis]